MTIQDTMTNIEGSLIDMVKELVSPEYQKRMESLAPFMTMEIKNKEHKTILLSLPRRTGVTTALKMIATHLTGTKLFVVPMVKDTDFYKDIPADILVLPAQRIGEVRGRTYDFIIADGISLEDTRSLWGIFSPKLFIINFI